MPGERDPNSPRLSPAMRSRQIPWLSFCLGVLLCAALSGVAQDGTQASTSKSLTPSAAKNIAGQAPATATASKDRRKQIADESNQLLSMALALKAEVDKTTKDTLSMNVIRKADEIEKLAHTVKEKVKQGPS